MFAGNRLWIMTTERDMHLLNCLLDDLYILHYILIPDVVATLMYIQ